MPDNQPRAYESGTAGRDRLITGKFGRKKRIPGKSLVTVGKSFEKQNRPLAEIILADQLTYYGLPVIWARLWQKNHPAAKKAKKVEAVQESLWQSNT